MVIDGSYTSDENSIIYKEVDSLCCTPQTNIVYKLYSNNTNGKKKEKENTTLIKICLETTRTWRHNEYDSDTVWGAR